MHGSLLQGYGIADVYIFHRLIASCIDDSLAYNIRNMQLLYKGFVM